MPANDPGSRAGGAGDLEAAHAVARLSKQLELALAEVDLTLPQYRALLFLGSGTAAPSTLAGQLAVTRPTITALMDGLVARGLVRRRQDPEDRRRTEHLITPEGSRSLRDADRVVAQRLASIAGHLSSREATRAREGLALWGRAIALAREELVGRR